MNSSSSPSHATVLVADDIAANRNLLRETLEPHGYEVLLVDNGETALKVALRTLPDVILLDINMPGLDGYQTCRRLKEQKPTRSIPVIFISANEGTQSLVEGFRAGAVDYLTKPFKAEEVLMRVETHLQINRLTRTLSERNDELLNLNRSLQAEITRRQRAEQALSLIGEKQAERFHAGGTLRHDAPSYIERQADRDLLAALNRGEFCHVLTSRQMGKSSLTSRTAHLLRQGGFDVVTLDLAAVGQNLTPEQWYDGLISRIGWQLRVEDRLEEFWARQERLGPVQRFLTAMREIVLAPTSRRLVIFVDELDMVRSLPFDTDEFFAAVRETYNRRSEDAAFERLAFCLLGVAAPNELTGQKTAAPFNVGTRIELHDFTWPEVLPLAHGLDRNASAADELLERIYYWTGGHPYLTQKLCHAVSADAAVQTSAAVDDVCHQRLLGPQAREQDDNLIFVRERLVRGHATLADLLPLYRRIRSGEEVVADEASPEMIALRLAGVVSQGNGRLRVRNRVYERVFDLSWVDRTTSSRSHASAP